MVKFVPGIALCRAFFHEVVQPIIHSTYPDLNYAAALIGFGSEVLGFDTPMSIDHDWGPRVLIFLDHAPTATNLDDVLSERLPHTFRGYPTRFGLSSGESASHHVKIHGLDDWLQGYLGITKQTALAMSPADWLSVPGQKLRTVTEGAVYHDGIGDLTTVREALAYYPHDVWLYLLAAGWSRIGEEEHFLGRTGFIGDELGSRLIAARLVHDLMNLCLLQARQYAPYSKWFGTAFAGLDVAPALTPVFQAVLDATTWQAREAHLGAAYTLVAEGHNALGITAPLSTQVSAFHDRPFQVIHAERFANALREQITDPAVLKIAAKPHIGSVEQFSDNTALLSYVDWLPAVRAFYTSHEDGIQHGSGQAGGDHRT
jgi:hypothetical protein